MNQLEVVKAANSLQRLLRIVNRELAIAGNSPIRVSLRGFTFRMTTSGKLIGTGSACEMRGALASFSMMLKLKRRLKAAVDLGLEFEVTPKYSEGPIRFWVCTELHKDKFIAIGKDEDSLSYKEGIGFAKRVRNLAIECAVEDAREATMQ